MPRPLQPKLPSAPKRQTTETPVTPLIGDLLLYEIEDYSGKSLPEYGAKHPKRRVSDPSKYKWPDHELVLCRPVTNEREGIFEFIYAAERANQDKYNFEFTQADIGGVKFDAVQRDYLIKRNDFDPASPAMNSAMPDVPAGKFTATSFVLAIRQQVRTEKELDSLYVAERRTYVRKVTTRQIGTDDLNGLPLTSSVTLYHKDETVGATGLTAENLFLDGDNTYWGLQANGTAVSGQQLSANWYAITTTQVVAGTNVGGVIQIDEYTSNENYYWPPVLAYLGVKKWARRDEGEDIYPDYEFDPEGYNGPCKATITRTWSKTPQVIPQVDIFQPERIQYASPGFSMSVPACLIPPGVSLVCDYGNSDPVYKINVGSLKTFGPTNYTAWPNTITAADGQVPFRGGYLRTQVVVNKPA